MALEQRRTLLLPMGLSTQADLSKVIREAEALDNFLRDGAIRSPGSPMQLPKSSKMFENLTTGSSLNMLQPEDREYLLKSLLWLRQNAPVLHMSFSSEPSLTFLEHLTTWLRQNISPFVLVQVGLRPNIGVGCVVRTTNKYFDFSLSRRFVAERDVLTRELAGQTSSVVPAEPVKT